MDKSKQHWEKAQERKRKEAEKENAEFESFMRTMNSMMRGFTEDLISCKVEFVQEELECKE